MKALFHMLTTLLVIPAAVLLTAAPAMAAGPGWQDVPGDLKNAAGVESNGGYVYATGLARALNIRPDKAHEVARKKSLLHALQLLHVACSCHDIVKGLRPEEQRKFFLLFALDFPPLYAKGLVVIRQWERGAEHLSTVALPQSALKDVPCEFPDLLTAISHYAGLENVTEEGLAFCLRHVPRYSHMAQVVQRRVGRFYLEQGMKTMALCFLKDREGPVSPLEVLGIQNRLARATQLNSLAERAARKGKWDVALDLTSRSLAILPTYGRAYLVLADYFLQVQKRPSFALCATEKAFRDGTILKKALEMTVLCMRELRSPEMEVYQFLASQCSKGNGLITYPEVWQEEIRCLSGRPVPYMVLVSAGQAVEGESRSGGLEYNRAADLFAQAKNDEDISRVLQLLFRACERQPASAETYNLIGACYRNLGRPSVAVPFLWQALNLRPEYDYALTNLGLCCQKLGLHQAAKYYFGYDAVKNSNNAWVRESYAKFVKTIYSPPVRCAH